MDPRMHQRPPFRARPPHQFYGPPELSNRNLYLTGLAPETSDQTLRELCSSFGPITSVNTIVDKETRKCRGYGFVMFENPADAEKALQGLAQRGIQASYARLNHKERMGNPMGQPEDTTNLYISNLPLRFTKENLEVLLGKFGKIISSRIMSDKYSGASRGIAFVRLSTKEECHSAIANLNGAQIDGSILSVKFADPPKNRGLPFVPGMQVYSMPYYPMPYAPPIPMYHSPSPHPQMAPQIFPRDNGMTFVPRDTRPPFHPRDTRTFGPRDPRMHDITRGMGSLNFRDAPSFALCPWTKIQGKWHVLLNISKNNKLGDMKYDPLRGHSEPGESPIQTACREAREESNEVLRINPASLGLAISDENVFHVCVNFPQEALFNPRVFAELFRANVPHLTSASGYVETDSIEWVPLLEVDRDYNGIRLARQPLNIRARIQDHFVNLDQLPVVDLVRSQDGGLNFFASS